MFGCTEIAIFRQRMMIEPCSAQLGLIASILRRICRLLCQEELLCCGALTVSIEIVTTGIVNHQWTLLGWLNGFNHKNDRAIIVQGVFLVLPKVI